MNDQGKQYDVIATGFAQMRNEFYKEKKYIDLFLQHLNPSAHLLDVGCGSGHPIASYMLEKGFSVTGIDSSKELLKIAKNKNPTMQFVYGDVRTVSLPEKYDGIIEWWCLFHLPKQDQIKMISRFATWLKKDGILEFTTGSEEYEGSDDKMLNQTLHFYSCNPSAYKAALLENGFELLLCESDQEQHLVWIARKTTE